MGQTFPRADLSCCVEPQDGGRVGTLCRVDLSPVVAAGAGAAARRAALVRGIRDALEASNRRLGLVCPRPGPTQFGRVVILLITADDRDVAAALEAMPFLRRGPKRVRSADAYATDVVSADAFAVPGFEGGWAEQGATALGLAGPVHVAVLTRRADTAPGNAPEFALLLGENHAHADGCAVPGGDGDPGCVSGLQLVNAAVHAPGTGVLDLFVEAAHDTRVPRNGAPSLLSVVERSLVVPCRTRYGATCPPQARVSPVDGRFTERAWEAVMAIAEKQPAAFLSAWRDVGGEAGLVAALGGIGPPGSARRCRERLNALLADHGAPFALTDGGGPSASRLQLAVDTLREQGRIGLLEAAFASAGPLPAAVWRRHLLGFVVELEAIASWLDTRVCTTSRGMAFVGGAFHTRRAVDLLVGLGMEVAFEKEAVGGPVALSAGDLAALHAACGISVPLLLAPSCLHCSPRQGVTRSKRAVTGLVVAGCQAACWVVRRADDCAVGLVVLPGRPGSVAATLDPYFLHFAPYDAAALAISSTLYGSPAAEIVAADATAGQALAWSAAEVLPRWVQRGKIARVYPIPDGATPDVGAVDVLATFIAAFASVPNTFPVAVGDFRDPTHPRRFARQIERLSGGALTAPWGHGAPARRLVAGRKDARVPVASGALLSVPPGADVGAFGVPVTSTYPYQVDSSHAVPWGVEYQTPDMVVDE